MMRAATLGRRAVLLGAVAAAGVYGTGQGRSPAVRPASAATKGRLGQRGVNFDTEREVWRADYVRKEIRAIRRDLHCNAVILLGSDLGRLRTAAWIAAREGLYVWFEPRKFDHDAEQTRRFVLSVARVAERLRRSHPGVGISVGCELTIFMEGLVPGKTWEERGESLGTPAGAGYNERLNAFLGTVVKAVRPVFGGRLTYTSGTWEAVDWRRFDVVGVDLYRDASNEATFAQDVRALHRFGKPVVITEFGCCTYRGAEKRGGMGFDIVDYSQDPPLVDPGYVRDERVQATYISELLDIFESEGVYGAFVYNFLDGGAPYSPDPRRDFDMAGFSLVKVLPAESGRGYAETGHWEPKASFRTLARRFAP